jgi:hypothetical protein
MTSFMSSLNTVVAKTTVSVRAVIALQQVIETHRLLVTFTSPGWHPQTGATPVARTLTRTEINAFNASLDYLQRQVDNQIRLMRNKGPHQVSPLAPMWLVYAHTYIRHYVAATTDYDATTSGGMYEGDVPPLTEPRNMTVADTKLYESCLELLSLSMTLKQEDLFEAPGRLGDLDDDDDPD